MEKKSGHQTVSAIFAITPKHAQGNSLSIVTRPKPINLTTGRVQQEPWKAKAAAKRAAILHKIGPQWRLGSADLKRASKQRDLTGIHSRVPELRG